MPRKESLRATSARLELILHKLGERYPNARIGLDSESPFELLIATILSAQCTDVRVNEVTKSLFAKYRKPSDYYSVPVEELERDIRSTGFYKNKARNIQKCCRQIDEDFGGEVPRAIEELTKLAGVGRKTANCVRSHYFHEPAITVDTHVTRISNLLGLVDLTDPVKIEYALMKLMPEDRWNSFDLLIITHGRNICVARKPHCNECPIRELCPSAGLS